MSTWRYITVITATSLCMFILAGIWHEGVMAHLYDRHHDGGHEGTVIIFIAYFILSAIMVAMFQQWRLRERVARKGILFGALIGLLWVFPHELAMAGAHGESLSYVLFNALWHVVEQGSGGLALALLWQE